MPETPLRSAEESLGAKFGAWFGCVLPSEFGGFDAEYRALNKTVALLDKNYRAWFSFTGPDRARYLNAILTNNVRDLAPGRAVPSLLLNAQGHIVAEMEVLSLPESLLVATYALVRESLAAAFEKYIIMDDVTMTDETAERGTLALEGPAAPAALEKLCGLRLGELSELGHREAEIAGIACRVQRRSIGGTPSAELLAARADLTKLWGVLREAVAEQGGCPAGYNALSAVRLEAGIPWFGYDFDESTLAHEAGLENSHISYTKGCYVGQEIVERVRSRGHVNRHLALLQFSGTAIPPRGAKLSSDAKEAGHVTRAAWSPAHGSPIAMGFVRREFLQPGTVLEWEHGSATVIPFP